MPPAAPTSLESLVDALTPGSLTLLPTSAAAHSLRRAYDACQRALGHHAWEPANVLSWPQFLDHLWSEAITSGLETRLLLNEPQEHSLWLDIVATEATLTSADSLAILAREAWSLANDYQAVPRLRATAATHDSRTFAAWAESFVKLCDRNQYLSRASLESALQQPIETRTLPAPPALTLVSFTDTTPAQQSLLEALQQAGTTLTQLTLEAPPVPNATRAILATPSEPDELRQLAQWLRSFLETRQQAGESSSIAVILPTPDDAPALESTFREVLAPELQSIAADTSSAPWEFPAGQPLATLPLIATALDLAHWPQSPLALTRISALLLSPYLNPPSTRDHTAQFDAEVLRQAHLLRPELDLPALLRLAQPSPLAPAWLKPFAQFLTKSGNLETPRTFADWAEFLRSMLASANFPIDSEARPLTSLEYHATQAWDSLLDQLSTLDFRGRRVPYSAFLQTLTRQAATTPFIPPSSNAPIQVLSPAAAAGQTFDALILTRATDLNYPATEHPNPLLNFALQASLNMPGADATQSAARAHRVLTQLLAGSPNLLITYTPETPEGHQRLAPIFAGLNLPHLDPIATPTPTQIPTLQTPDTTPLPPLPSAEVAGGARVLKLQAACGFLAFSELRLRSTGLDTQSPGFDALESGNILHRTLEKFWKQVQTQERLRSMTRSERGDLLTQCIDASIPQKLPIETPWDSAYLAVQKQRLRTVLQNWLDEELKRSPFIVLANEREELITIGPLTLHVRMDRIDQVEGGHFFVDYKTGYAADPSQWEGDRPEEPQLPLYSLFSEPGELKGLAFAKVRAGSGVEWRGYQSELGILPGKRVVDIDSAIDQWRHTLAHLAEDFASGVADVNPKDFAVNCARCAQRLLCRINPESFLAQLDADPDANESGDDQ